MKRIDSRNFDEIRPVKITLGFAKFAEGSCLIELGDTKVISTASLEEGVPPFLRGKGTGWLTSEYGMLPYSTQTRIQRDRISGRSFEIQRLIGRALRSIIDLDKIGERTIWVDCDVIQADGGTRTASITGGFIALVESLRSAKERGIISEIPVNKYLAAISVGILEGELILDLNYYEDSRAEVDMNVVMSSEGNLIEVQGTAEKGSFTEEELQNMLSLAKKGIDELVKLERNILKHILFL